MAAATGTFLGLPAASTGMTVKQPKDHLRRSAARSHPSRQVTDPTGLFRDISPAGTSSPALSVACPRQSIGLTCPTDRLTCIRTSVVISPGTPRLGASPDHEARQRRLPAQLYSRPKDQIASTSVRFPRSHAPGPRRELQPHGPSSSTRAPTPRTATRTRSPASRSTPRPTHSATPPVTRSTSAPRSSPRSTRSGTGPPSNGTSTTLCSPRRTRWAAPPTSPTTTPAGSSASSVRTVSTPRPPTSAIPTCPR